MNGKIDVFVVLYAHKGQLAWLVIIYYEVIISISDDLNIDFDEKTDQKRFSNIHWSCITLGSRILWSEIWLASDAINQFL